MKDFFISYNKKDRKWAEWIAWHLEKAKYSVIIQAWDFRPGDNFVLKMDKALKEANQLIAVLSPNYLQSDYCQPEWTSAFRKDPKGVNRKFIPIRIEPCELDGLLSSIIYIDLVGIDNSEAAKKAILEGIKKGRAKPSNPPEFPPHHLRLQEPPFPGSNDFNNSSIPSRKEKSSSDQLESIPCAYCKETGKEDPLSGRICPVCKGKGYN
jgi:hypothetical protein